MRIEFVPAAKNPGALVAHVAWLGFDLVSDVRAGENRGRELHHDFVVLEFTSARLEPQADGYVAAVARADNLIASPRKGLAVWVTRQDSQAPLQAAGGWLAAAD